MPGSYDLPQCEEKIVNYSGPHSLTDPAAKSDLGRKCVYPCVLAFFLGMPQLCGAVCREKPTVLMDERTADTHLLSKKDFVLPANVPTLARVRKVIVLVTVDREGSICEVKAVAGPLGLRKAAAGTVKEHWRYRRFLVDWKPVVAQFPVSVKFVLPKGEPLKASLRKHETSQAIAS